MARSGDDVAGEDTVENRVAGVLDSWFAGVFWWFGE